MPQVPFIMGWQEWVALPDLGVPAIKAKIDTGARTSALHAFDIEPCGTDEAPMVAFNVRPLTGRDDIVIACRAPIVGRRAVTSSNGERETRYFIRSAIAVAGRAWEIEIGLTNRNGMTYRMLLGRQAITSDMVVDPTASFRQPRLGYRLYRRPARRITRTRSLRIALVGGARDGVSARRLVAAAEARGHVVEWLDPAQLVLTFMDGHPLVLYNGSALPAFDAAIPRFGGRGGSHAAAVVRQLEMQGAWAVNSGDALDRIGNPRAVAQALSGAGVTHALWPGDIAGPSHQRQPNGVRILVVGGEAVATSDAALPELSAARTLAVKAAAALGLGFVAVDIEMDGEKAQVNRLSARPALTRFEGRKSAELAREIIAMIEARAGVPRPAPQL